MDLGPLLPYSEKNPALLANVEPEQKLLGVDWLWLASQWKSDELFKPWGVTDAWHKEQNFV